MSLVSHFKIKYLLKKLIMLKIIAKTFARRSKRNQVPRLYRLAEFNTKKLYNKTKEKSLE
jgi:hypothetical protein